MSNRFLSLLAAVCVTGIIGASLYADDNPGLNITGPSIEPPTTAPATAPATNPSTAPAVPTTQNSADAALNKLLSTPTAAPVVPATTLPSNPAVTPAATGVAPHQPVVNRLREGQPVWNHLGRMVKDQAGTGYMFVFESDGKTMQDPPMPLLPCRMLQQMEAASGEGAKPVVFRVSGQVTEYHGKNYLLVNFQETTKDLGRGLD